MQDKLKKLVIPIIAFILSILMITGCSSESTNKNIYHSKWKSSSGYTLIINDPELNTKLSKPTCVIKLGEEELGICIVDFYKETKTLKIQWTYLEEDKNDIKTISSDTDSFYLDDVKFDFLSNIE